MSGKRIASYRGHVIWYYDGAYMVAMKRDGTDEYYETIEDAFLAIDQIEDNKGK